MVVPVPRSWRSVGRRVLIGSMLGQLAACGPGWFAQPQVVVDISFSQSARHPAALAALTDSIELTVSGEGMEQPITRRLEPEAQLVSLTLPTGEKAITGRAWQGGKLLAEGQTGLVVRRGRPQEVIIHLIPIWDPPPGYQGRPLGGWSFF